MIKQVVVRGYNTGIGRIKNSLLRFVISYLLVFLALFFFLLAMAEFIALKITFFTKAELYLLIAIVLVVLSLILKKFRFRR